MSAIGDYVHLYSWNYLDCGFNKIHERNPSISAAAALKNQRTLITNKIKVLESSKQTKNLEKELNSLIDFLGTGDTKDGTDTAVEAVKVMKNLITSDWQEHGQKRLINMSTLNVTSNNIGRVGKIKSRGHYINREHSYEQTLKDRIIQLNNAMTTLQKNLENTNTDVDEYQLIQDIKEIRKYMNDNFKLINQYLNETDLAGGKIRSENEREAIKKINNFIKIYAPFLDDAKQKGTLFENAIALVPAKIQSLGATEMVNTIEKSIQKNVQGGFYAKNSYKKDAFITGMIEKGKIGQEITTEYNAMIQKVSESQQKIDVSFEYKGEQMNISAKNLNIGKGWKNLNKDITITSGNPLLSLLQDESADFVNHYLNLFSSNPAYETQIGVTSSFGFLRAQYLDMLKMLILYKGLTGDVYGRNEELANILIVNNNSDPKKHVKVVNIKALIQKILRSKADLIKVQVNNSPLNENMRYTNIKIGNDEDPWARTGTARIKKILIEAHAQKIRAAIPVGSLMNLTSSVN